MSEEPKQEPVFVNENEKMDKVLDLLTTKKVHRIFVTDSQQRPIGVISLCDLIRLLKIN
jgi:predicted transcriptional regulator